jgi:2-polyprenyl-3-methyl-5-hydroxy-6-metoxy-1,4-benzoquinol methylase
MDKVKCPMCYTEVEERSFKETYVSPYNNQENKRYECPNCDVHWWEPLKIIPEFYESEVFENYIAFHEGVGTRLGENYKAFFKHFPSNVRGKLLDVGCGDGRFLRHAKEQGFEVWGIDFDKKSIENVKRNLGIDTVFAMSLEEFYEYAKERGLKFDVITFFEVLEHQDKPSKFPEMVKGLLKEGEYIAGSVPNRKRFLREIYWKISHADHPPHHFLRFSRRSLENALKLSGFENTHVYIIDFTFDEIYPYVEMKLLGRFYNLRNLLKSMVLGDRKRAGAYVDDIVASSTSHSEKIRAYLLKGIKLMRNVLLFPFAFVYIKKAQHRGPHLYFQARKPND